MSRVLALDIGNLRCGLALSDKARRHASPLSVLATRQLRSDNTRLRELMQDYEVTQLLVGLPLERDGSQGRQARHVRALAAQVLSGLDRLAPCVFFDERFSSAQASEAGHAAGLTTRDMRGQLDSRAAAAFLQRWLDDGSTKSDISEGCV